MKNIILTLYLCVAGFALHAQEINKQVVASAGSDESAGNYQISQTIGEAVVTTHTQGNYILCQGFQQADGLTSVAIKELENFKFSFYPNPVQTELNVHFEENLQDVTFAIYSPTGQLINQTSFKNEQEVKLNLDGLSTGIYFVQFNVKTENVRFEIVKQ